MVTTDEEIEAHAQAVRLLEDQLQDRMLRGHTLGEVHAQLKAEQQSQFRPYPPLLAMRLEALDQARLKVEKRLEAVSYWRKAAIKCGRPDWYGGPGEDATIWHAFKTRLASQGRSQEEIDGVDHDSTAVVSLLDNPGLAEFSTRGLVIGHVQSGKTGNMAAVIAKAADTRYKFFLVLSGLTDSLRNQTQTRLDGDLLDNGHPERWFSWTHVDRQLDNGTLEKGDFRHPPRGGFLLDGPKNHLAVVKKNASILRRFLNKLRATPRAVLQQTSFLIIDDECDQASVNSAQLRTAISTINRLIREIVEYLPKVAYVGYTATPFANVLINPNEAEDLYPRDFIHPLARPASYFGAVELFGREALEGEDTGGETGYDMIRLVPDHESDSLRPAPRQAASFRFEVTPGLKQAIGYFILATAAREARGQGREHSTMLLHTSMLNSVHKSTKEAVEPYLASVAERLGRGDGTLRRELRELWQMEAERVMAGDFGMEAVAFEEFESLLATVAESIQIKVENWTSQDRIDYSTPACRYLVIGGNVLARGLTLNGLVVSFFMRTSSQYDTLMQMGRWFGYRKGFAELPRVWMEPAVRDAFFDLATVEEEIRSDAARYAEENITPEQFALRIRKIPGLAITARAKMRDARIAQVGYEGEHLQTIRFRRHDKDWLDANWRAGARLLEHPGTLRTAGSNHIKAGVDCAAIRAFFASYEVEGGASMRRDLLLAYIDKIGQQNSSLAKWNVAVIGSGDSRRSSEPLGPPGDVSTVSRSPLRNSGNVAFIKALMSRRDLLADVEEVPAGAAGMSWKSIKEERERLRMPPLLLLYPIDRNSEPTTARTRTSREPMDAAMDILGIGIVFPGSPGSGMEYVQADIQPEDAEEEYIGEDALPAELIDDAR